MTGNPAAACSTRRRRRSAAGARRRRRRCVRRACSIGLGPLNDNSFLTHLATGRLIWRHPRHPAPRPVLVHRARRSPGWCRAGWRRSSTAWPIDSWGAAGRCCSSWPCSTGRSRRWCGGSPGRRASLISRLADRRAVLVVGCGRWLGRAPAAVRAARRWPRAAGRRGPPRPPLAGPGHVGVGQHPTARSRSGWWRSGCLALGRAARSTRIGRRREHPGLKWAVVGTLLGAVNPLGPRLLVFPIELLGPHGRPVERRSSGRRRRSCDFGQRAFLVLLAPRRRGARHGDRPGGRLCRSWSSPRRRCSAPATSSSPASSSCPGSLVGWPTSAR